MLSDICTHCVCSDNFTGLILSNNLLPLANVTISPLLSPYAVLATTGIGGRFEIDHICDADTYVLRKPGYVDTAVVFGQSSFNITMQQLGEC